METVRVGADPVSAGSSLPRFLKPCLSQRSTRVAVPVHAVYAHKHPFGDAQVLWWPAGTRACDGASEVVPRTILLFIPGTSSHRLGIVGDGASRSGSR